MQYNSTARIFWFRYPISNAELTDEDIIMPARYLNSGTYGTLKHSVEKSMEKFTEKNTFMLTFLL